MFHKIGANPKPIDFDGVAKYFFQVFNIAKGVIGVSGIGDKTLAIERVINYLCK